MENILEFKQKDDKYGSCECILNGHSVDTCDMNWKDKFTQSHVVLASAYRTLKTKNITVIITGNAEVGQYPIDKIKGMADYQVDAEFNDVFGYTRVYTQLVK